VKPADLRTKSPSGVVHRMSIWERRGEIVTECGYVVGEGWGWTRERIDCFRCLVKAKKERAA
jgi:hypothetical protein